MTEEYQKTTLHCQEGTSNKLYVIWMEKSGPDYVVNAQWGAVGKAMQGGTKTPNPVSLEAAQKIMEKVIKQKLAKGYKPHGEEAPAYTMVDGVKDTGVRVMLLTAGTEDDLDWLIKDDAWVAQEKKNGKHVAITIMKDGVIGSNRRGLECPIPNEIVYSLAKLDLNDSELPLILDGELIGDTFHVFDMIIKDASMLSRYDTLEHFYKQLKCKNIKIVEVVEYEDKKAFVKKMQDGNKEGVVFKRVDEKYVPGKIMNIKKAIAIKVKFYEEGSFIVEKWNEKNSIAISVYLDAGKNKVSVGNVTVHEKYKDQIKVGGIVGVKYLYATDASILYQPNLNPDDNGDVMRDDITEEDCKIEQLKYEGK